MVINSRVSSYNLLAEYSKPKETPIDQHLSRAKEIEKSSKIEASNRTEIGDKRTASMALENLMFRAKLDLA